MNLHDDPSDENRFRPAGRPAAPVAEQWSEAGEHAGGASAGALAWQDFVTDEPLRALIELAQNNNRGLRQTLLDVEAARAQYRVQRADRLPGLDAQGTGTRQRVPGDLNGTDRSQVQSSYQAGVGLTAFELDLFGRVRNLSEAALEEYLASEEAARAARVALVAEVIQAYLTRDGAQRRHLLTAETLRAREASLALIARRRQAGTASALDHQEAVGLAEQARAELERISREFRQAGNALQLLVGDAGPRPPQRPGADTVLVQDIAAGAPAELLAYRPDIRAAEHRLRARNASIGAARAAFFPRISLTGLLGSSSAELSDLFEGGQRAWSFTPQIVLPIFDGGRNRANLDLAAVRRDSAVAGYEQTIQTAFREVSDALAATDTLRREEAARRALARSTGEALRLAEARYRAGVDDHLRYLDAQRSDFASQSALIEVATQRQIALADLFRALGGGWLADVPLEPAAREASSAANLGG
ncbi:efflux transporter outer membrane subunit [Pseudothauera rhizosphaerae]|uniref:Efflux transporter outer membrane subunit n=1 Tax=Pseudothauera rhizosphaerae TaxID=2565932 RepID=A0A4V3WAZ5_9RHOO|nr:efflux transporter outer membrane subunit [Pseudothauera rhizosphaerae]